MTHFFATRSISPILFKAFFLTMLGFSQSALSAFNNKHVFIISIDGGKPSVIQKSQMPTLTSLLSSSAHSWQALTINPSVTLPSHVSMLTGVGPEVHGVTWNEWEPNRPLLNVQTIFSRAKSEGLVTALFAGKEKFKHLNTPGSLNQFTVTDKKGLSVAKAAAKYILDQKPHLAFIHLPDADTAGHKSGWDSTGQKNALKIVDQAIAIVLNSIETAGIANNSTVIITADHGGTGWFHSSDIPENRTIPWIIFGGSVKQNYTLKSPISTMDTAATALWLLDVKFSGVEGRPVVEAFNNF